MSTIRELLARAQARLTAAGIESARADARILLAAATQRCAGEIVAGGEIPTVEQAATFEMLLERRERREPVAYVTGQKEFWSLPFRVGPGVLIPRPETETLIEEAIRTFPDRTAPLQMLDLGTGSGCILIAALSEYPEAGGTGTDRSEAALEYARLNAANLGVRDRCRLKLADWNDGVTGGYDLIFSNPPYVGAGEIEALDPDVANHEPHSALTDGQDALSAYRALAPRIRSALNPSGWAFVELGAGQAAPVKTIFESGGLEVRRIAPDLSGIPRCIAATRRA